VERSGVGMLFTWVRKFVGASWKLLAIVVNYEEKTVLTPYMYAGEPRARLEM
jgi:hypothetical protein